jgi:ABC-2 type transport system ATP-binding protein
VVIQSGHTVADGTPEQVRSAGGARKTVRFSWIGGAPAGLEALPGVTAVDVEGREVTLRTTDADATVWGLYGLRDHLSGLEVTGGGLREAFLALTAAHPDPPSA